uniref:N-acetylglucosaminylphosphatidylinositol deacetylase n=1 Tax=Kwoniella bestiolae CBS 10118 TaxID=1296100 RepID=A0A1B9GF36_9TREE|nr:hypothetical protein I302_01128 [Kwoniella bestiolae CBS 10118]OCF29619.1 hypothetical protein I302_01128 [Kwoniella bestiolae CBS 10118]
MPPTPRHPKSSAPSTPRAISPLLLFSFLLPLLALLFPYSHLLPSSSREPHFSSYVRFDSTSTTHSPKALLLTAHPDDEVMFFSPTILSLVKEGWEVSGLCLSTGNSSGLGQIRTEELHSSYEYLGVDRGNVKVVDHPNLQDSMSSHWDPELIADLLNNHLKDHPVDLVHNNIRFNRNNTSSKPHLPSPLPPPLVLRYEAKDITPHIARGDTEIYRTGVSYLSEYKAYSNSNTGFGLGNGREVRETGDDHVKSRSMGAEHSSYDGSSVPVGVV